MEPYELIAGVAAGRGQKADLGQRLAGQREHVAIERRRGVAHREAATTHREDLAAVQTGLAPTRKTHAASDSASAPAGAVV